MSDSATPWTQSARLFWPLNSSYKNAGVGSHSLLQGIFLTQESNQGLLHCRQILYRLSPISNYIVEEILTKSFSSKQLLANEILQKNLSMASGLHEDICQCPLWDACFIKLLAFPLYSGFPDLLVCFWISFLFLLLMPIF